MYDNPCYCQMLLNRCQQNLMYCRQQYNRLSENIPPFASLTKNELNKIMELEEYFGNKYYLVAFERPMRNFIPRYGM